MPEYKALVGRPECSIEGCHLPQANKRYQLCNHHNHIRLHGEERKPFRGDIGKVRAKTGKSSKKAKVVPIKKMVTKLDQIFSLWTRLKYADEKGMVKCYTSGKYYHYLEIQAGHFHSRRHYALRWDEKNVKPQSVSQNIFVQGNAATFALNLTREYGASILELLEAKKNSKFKLERFYLEALIQEYTEKVRKRKVELNIK